MFFFCKKTDNIQKNCANFQKWKSKKEKANQVSEIPEELETAAGKLINS